MKQRNYAGHPGYEAWVTKRFWARVDKSGECWVWTGQLTSAGYGILGYRNRKRLAHRHSYWLTHGELPEGLDIDHMCRTRSCVRPDHLRAVTHRENILAGETFAAALASRTVCARGHQLAGENIRTDAKGYRQCLPCLRARWRRKEERRAAERRANPKPRKPRARPEACRQGHLFTAETTITLPTGRRRCRICETAYQQARPKRPPAPCPLCGELRNAGSLARHIRNVHPREDQP